ncbi:hypothetical protein Moror_1380 [Moniliophthora roreri MCA 2997]|uniref:Retrotransposon gag domain-containing protein n=1 Tax=Moniliophthora roreri (strain MCA 2997) TaxID=1381753 RepID=V2WQR4_MONRO|nr:hypothetical protein Moror_1380 [Moniliophthora roreri MCA 2997]
MDYKPNQYQTLLLLQERPLPTETPKEWSGTRRTLTPPSIVPGSEENESEGDTFPPTSKKKDSDTSTTSLLSAEEQDPFEKLLAALKNSPRSKKHLPIEEMAEEKKPSGSMPKSELEPEETTIGATVSVQVVVVEKEVKAALPRMFMGQWKDAKKFLREVQLYIALNSKTFSSNRTKKLFLLSYMMDRPGEFWKNDKTDLLLARDPEAEKISWLDFVEEFKMAFEPLDMALEAKMKLRDLKMKERADKYTYQFMYLANKMGYNNVAKIEAFKRGLPKGLMLKIANKTVWISHTVEVEFKVSGKEFREAFLIFRIGDKEMILGLP